MGGYGIGTMAQGLEALIVDGSSWIYKVAHVQTVSGVEAEIIGYSAEGAVVSGGSKVAASLVDDVLRTGADDVVKSGRNIIHHLASNKHLSKYTPQFESIANKYGLKLDAVWNKVDISDVYHYSKHPSQYHEFVLKGMRTADAGAAGNKAKFLQLFDQYVKQPLLQNPNMLNKTGWL